MDSAKRKSEVLSGSSSEEQPEVIFFIDRSLGKTAFPGVLQEAGIDVRVHDDHLVQDAPDEDWLKLVGQNNWVAITGDKMIPYRRVARTEIQRSKVALFILSTGGKQTGKQKAKIFLDALPAVQRFIKKNKPPYIVKIWRGGQIGRVK